MKFADSNISGRYHLFLQFFKKRYGVRISVKSLKIGDIHKKADFRGRGGGGGGRINFSTALEIFS